MATSSSKTNTNGIASSTETTTNTNGTDFSWMDRVDDEHDGSDNVKDDPGKDISIDVDDSMMERTEALSLTKNDQKKTQDDVETGLNFALGSMETERTENTDVAAGSETTNVNMLPAKRNHEDMARPSRMDITHEEVSC
jgi:hypothetical protein